MRQPAVRFDDLPPISIVLLSHNHYDHLDLATLRRLADRGQSQFIVPAGVARLLRTRNIGPGHELDWGESLPLGRTIIHGVPAQHFSARGIFDRNLTLWCGYVIETPDRIIYFAGDTGFGDHFAMIRERFGAPHLALLPIGAYEPRWFMSPVHMSPDGGGAGAPGSRAVRNDRHALRQVPDFLGVRLDELAPGRHVAAHEHLESPVDLGGVLEADLQQRAIGRIMVVSRNCSGFISPRPL